MKICKKCNEPKGLFDFSSHPTTKDRLQAYCKPCARLASKEHAQRNPGRNRRQKYGLHQDDYEAMLLKQGFRCAICDMIMAKPNVDHDHKTKAVRGLLCWHCNVGLGHFFDNRQLLERAMGYLQSHGD
jgi:hypothetical protein